MDEPSGKTLVVLGVGHVVPAASIAASNRKPAFGAVRSGNSFESRTGALVPTLVPQEYRNQLNPSILLFNPQRPDLH